MSVVCIVTEEAINPGIIYVGSDEKSIDRQCVHVYIHTHVHTQDKDHICVFRFHLYGDKCVYTPTRIHRRTETTYV